MDRATHADWRVDHRAGSKHSSSPWSGSPAWSYISTNLDSQFVHERTLRSLVILGLIGLWVFGRRLPSDQTSSAAIMAERGPTP